jgi:hypothetical protein
MGLDTKTYWLTDRQSQCNFDFDFDVSHFVSTVRECVLWLQWYFERIIQWECYNYCVKISYQETSTEDRNLLYELWLQWYFERIIQWECYNYCVKISYQETSSEDRNLLYELWLQWYLEYVVQWDCYSWLWWRSVSGQQIRYPIRNPVERHCNTWQYLKHLCVWERF